MLNLKLIIGTCLAIGVAGHGFLVMPPPRNAIDSELPPWSNGKHPRTGTLEALPCDCTNGTDPYCNSGQACFWFSQGACSLSLNELQNQKLSLIL